MKLTIIGILFASLATLAGATVEVTLGDPGSFRDFSVNGRSADKTAPHFQSEVERFAESRLSRHLPEGHTLRLHITDMDMAGEIEPWRNRNFADIRYVKSIYPPRMSFDYAVVDAAGETVTSGQTSITDMAFDFGISPMSARNGSFHYELKMLEDWVRQEIRSLQQGGAA